MDSYYKSSLENYIKYDRSFHLFGECPICNQWHLAGIRCKDVEFYNSIVTKIINEINLK